MGRSLIGAFGATVAVALLAPAVGAAQTPLPVGEAEGVRMERRTGAIVFTKEAVPLWRRIAGRRVTVSCVDLPPADARGYVLINFDESSFRAPKRGRRLGVGSLSRHLDYCRVWLARRTVRRNGERTVLGRRLIVSIPLTQRGAVFLDEQLKAFALLGLITIAGFRGEARYSTYDELLEESRPRARRLIVPLASPGDTPPPGRLGYYSDGQDHVAAVTLSATGRRLFLELAADDVLHTNVAGYLYADEID